MNQTGGERNKMKNEQVYMGYFIIKLVLLMFTFLFLSLLSLILLRIKDTFPYQGKEYYVALT